jgi:hypothetical protein
MQLESSVIQCNKYLEEGDEPGHFCLRPLTVRTLGLQKIGVSGFFERGGVTMGMNSKEKKPSYFERKLLEKQIFKSEGALIKFRQELRSERIQKFKNGKINGL